jgi:hypothetical protein
MVKDGVFVAIMLQTGRLKDHARIVQFMEHEVVDQNRLTDILERHGSFRNGKNSTDRMRNKKYPDVSELLRQKAERRKRLARLSFEEKVAIVNKWRKLTRNIRNSQEAAKPHQMRGPDSRLATGDV